jgi:exonuclease III
MYLNICSVNVNGLRNANKRISIFNWLVEKKFDIILLQETHCRDENESRQWGFQWKGKSFWCNGSSSSKGVAVLFKQNFSYLPTDIYKDNEGRIMSFQINLDNKEYRISNIYAPNNANERRVFIQKLQTLLSTLNTAQVIAGDFNCVFNNQMDRKSRNGLSRPDETLRELNNLNFILSTEDIWRRRFPNKKEYTFTRNDAKSRIDFFLTSKQMDPEIHKAKIINFVFSDHNAISLSIRLSEITRGQGLWKLNTSILSKSDYIDLIENAWQSWRKEKGNFKTKREWWDMTKHKFKLLTIEYCRVVNRRQTDIRILENRLNELHLNSDTIESAQKISYLTQEIKQYHENKANAARIRSKVKHYEENEKSTKYFFDLEKIRGQTKLWSSIKTETGEKLFGINNILNEQCKFYKKLFTTEGIDFTCANELLSSVDKQIDQKTATKLESDITIHELETAVYSLKASKSPGSDGICAEFYQTFWYLIKFDFLEVVEEISKCYTLCNSHYKGILTLLYKNGERELLKNWRPITLLNVDYKIIAKCLSNRLKPILPIIIHPDQKGYVDGRNINEANRYIQDLISYTDVQKHEGLIIFLDQTKAFDRCEWQWINLCLKKFGFGNKFSNWINMMLSGSKIAIQTNGFLSEFFTISRSIKQGCPVAPLLYIIQAEPMACKIRKNTQISGIKLPIVDTFSSCAKINQFVDDTQLFAKNEASLPYIFKDLHIYEKASGAKMNKEKTKGLMIGKNRHSQPTFTEIIWTKDYVKTLGICHGYNINDDDIWRSKITKIKSCLQVWKCRNLSLYGRVLIIKTFVFSAINFEIETRGISDKYIREIEN